ncbi:hypothetical protein TanjilG_04153 [Lupinus angustifolius]|uniref:peptidylprolyl isomerase n=1 Tax=Lupinus angustifolius TaxID=3871 RepID=A0A4P1RJA7_LUPAN|nr:hypothetical protein TanjilG_04153 [Lupinus angustifolius]
MVSAAIARNVVGAIGNVISFGLFFSPAPTFYGIIKKKNVEEFKPDPYLATVLNCAFWVFYGLPFVHPNSLLVLSINAVGLGFEFIYLTIFYVYAPTKGRKKVLLFLLIEGIFFAAVVLITMLVLHGTYKRSLVVGIICDVFNVMMYASPLTIMAKVIKSKSVKYMPFWLSLANFLNGVCWTTYALIHPFDIYVLISNSIGAFSGLIQLTLYACYCGNKGQDKDDVESKPKEKGKSFSLKQCAISIALAVGLITGVPTFGCPTDAHAANPVLPDLSVLISGPPIKDPGALLRYALPIDNKAIREVQKPLEDITDSLKIAGVKALDSVERNARQASRALEQGKTLIVSGLAESKKEHGVELLNKLEAGIEELQLIVQDRNRDAVASKQKELLQYVGGVEEYMVDGFPYEVPEEYRNMPLLKGRAEVDMKVKIKDNPNLEECVFHIVLDGYNAPVTAGNFVDLVERHFYDGMEIQRADGFVVQTGDPEGPAEGFIDPSTEKTRTIPLELMVEGEKAPVYGATLEELGLYKAQTKLPFNAFGTMAMARDEFENNSGSSQVFWLLKESELTPSNANILDGRYAVFGYVTINEDYLADLKVGDIIESIQVVSGLQNLVNPTYKIAG